MTNEQLTLALFILIGWFIGGLITQLQTNRRVSKRLDGHSKCIALFVEGWDKQSEKNKERLEVVTQQLEAILARIPRPRDPPET